MVGFAKHRFGGPSSNLFRARDITMIAMCDLQLALVPIWKAYEAALPGADAPAILQKIIKGLGILQAGCTFLLPGRCIAHLLVQLI